MKRENLLHFLFALGIIGFFLYSFTQIDLSLTLSKASVWQDIQKSFQHIGYFQRPLSTLIFLILTLFLFLIYSLYLKFSLANKLTRKKVWYLIIFISIVLSFSYNAFSYDIFNNIFDAKILTYYHQNPFIHKALDFPNDSMLSFMHWTHRTYPYGPMALILTLPASFLGFNYFLPTFFLFKILNAGFYLGTAYLIEKILQKENKKTSLFGLTLFALNPLVIIESLISAHNDIMMLFFATLGVYFLFTGKTFYSYFFILFSALIKFVTAVLVIPFLLRSLPMSKKLATNIDSFASICLLFMGLATTFILTKLEIQPWYFLWFIPFLALLRPRAIIIFLTIGLSLGLLLRYTIFLYQGNWDGYAPEFKLIVSLIVPLIFISFYFLQISAKKLLKIV